MAIYVKRFSVKHKGKVYGPGDIIRGISSEEAKKLADESHGTMVIIENEQKQAKSEENILPPVIPSKITRGSKK